MYVCCKVNLLHYYLLHITYYITCITRVLLHNVLAYIHVQYSSRAGKRRIFEKITL